ncbi:MAG: hypothetical protein ACRDYF_16880 [Acidimicrobiia bacterium]
MSRILNYTDRQTCVLFGDAAGAVVLSAVRLTTKPLQPRSTYPARRSVIHCSGPATAWRPRSSELCGSGRSANSVLRRSTTRPSSRRSRNRVASSDSCPGGSATGCHTPVWPARRNVASETPATRISGRAWRTSPGASQPPEAWRPPICSTGPGICAEADRPSLSQSSRGGGLPVRRCGLR